MSAEEKVIHDKAIKLRKMTDKKLVEAHEGSYQNGFNDGMACERKNTLIAIEHVNGIGEMLLWKIKKAIEAEL